ncbi:MAG: hypothetical protein H6744_05550 [Deltaproteobacteria bacterium]|nr:hypothetical protein [Deltaproteobacteria bacterium]MCB9786144.1 hypothetical protein [Deltaproteobacteria bacterium]
MSALATIDRAPSLRKRLVFGVTLLVAFGAFAGLAAWTHRPALAWGLGAAGLAAMLLSPLPHVGRALYVGWMGLGLAIGSVTGPIMLFVVYALLVAPLGLAMRLGGRDVLERRPDPAADSYWRPHPGARDRRRYLRPY